MVNMPTNITHNFHKFVGMVPVIIPFQTVIIYWILIIFK